MEGALERLQQHTTQQKQYFVPSRIQIIENMAYDRQ